MSEISFRCVRKHLSLDTYTAQANALVSSRLDYCNSLLHSIPGVHLNKWQHVQHALARVVTKSNRITSTKLLLEQLHWPPIAYCIDFKIATLTYKEVHLKQDLCLAQHLKLKSMRLNTRNNDQLLLQCCFVATNSTVMDITLSDIQHSHFEINFHTQFVMHIR